MIESVVEDEKLEDVGEADVVIELRDGFVDDLLVDDFFVDVDVVKLDGVVVETESVELVDTAVFEAENKGLAMALALTAKLAVPVDDAVVDLAKIADGTVELFET